MSFHYSPKIVRENLVLSLDAANDRSFVSGSTVWNDLSSNMYQSTLINGPTFDSSNCGSISFDGVDDYGTIPYTSDFDLSSTDYTLEGWFKSNSFSGEQSLISKDTYGVSFDWALLIHNATTLIFYSNGTATNVTATVPTLLTGQWYHYVVTSISGVCSIYLNGVLYNSDTMSTSNNSQVYVTVGCYGWNNPNGFTNGHISNLKIYRKGLTSSEVQQNYNTLKTRYI